MLVIICHLKTLGRKQPRAGWANQEKNIIGKKLMLTTLFLLAAATIAGWTGFGDDGAKKDSAARSTPTPGPTRRNPPA